MPPDSPHEFKKQKAMTDLTPRDDIKKKVSEILKRVDQLLKAAELNQAVQQLARAKEVDPKNVYILAYEERVAAMAKEREQAEIIEAKRKAEDEERKKEEDAKRKVEEERQRELEEARRKTEEERRKKEEEQRRKEKEEEKKKEAEQREREEEERKQEQERRKAEQLRRQKEEEREVEQETRKKIDARRKNWDESDSKPLKVSAREEAPPSEDREIPEISRSVLDETKQRILADRKKKGAPELDIDHSKKFRHAYDEGLDIYKRVMVEAWADGATTRAEEEQLESLRASLMITPEDHSNLEREAKIEAYSNAFRRAWSTGAISPESASSLAGLRKKFKINIEEHEQIETKLLWELRSSSQKAQLLIIDDDEKLLHLLSDTLQDAGYQTVAYTTSDEAYSFLQSNTPDIILSDINLETSTMGGFTFYEKVREIERLHEIPFIFLSGLTDEVLVRTGKELGVDDYLTKPFSEENLIATIKGKLKRYRQLRKSRQRH